MLKSEIFRLRLASGLVILEMIDLGGGITGSGLEKSVSSGMFEQQHPIIKTASRNNSSPSKNVTRKELLDESTGIFPPLSSA